MKAELKTMKGQKSWTVKNDTVELALTQKGGHMAPVNFYSNTKNPVQPYFICPWAEDKTTYKPPVIDVLRGDFFCMPFGANNDYKKEHYEVHGEPAGSSWKGAKISETEDATVFSVRMDTKVRPGTITKTITLKKGHNAVYIDHLLDGFTGKMTIGHHPTLALPEEEEGMLISTAPIQFGRTAPRGEGQTYAYGEEYYALAPDAKFTSLKKVPTVWKQDPYTDCSAFPKREGFVDILGLIAKPGKNPHWTAAVVPSAGYLWFSLKNPKVLPTTVLWMSNKGRHAAPWSGRNRCIGLEDVCAYLAEGLVDSAKKNPIQEAGAATVVTLSKSKPTVVRHIQGVVKVPKTFDRVKSVQFGAGELTFVSESGKKASTKTDWDFITM
jgi:hypothetical protein